MRLPQELRDQIYRDVFPIAFHPGRSIHSPYVFNSTTFALLRTCRLVRKEIGNAWIHQLCLYFTDPEKLLDKFAGIPIAVRGQIRHVHITDDRLIFYDGDRGEGELVYRTAQVLRLLPGLKLDRLTVEGGDYATLDMLVRYSDGWKELRFISHDSRILDCEFGPSSGPSDLMRQPQPSDWQNVLEQRHGQESRPSVVVHRAIDTVPLDPYCSQWDPDALRAFTQAFDAAQDAESRGLVDYATLMRRPKEIGKGMLVIVRRGAGVDYAEKEGSPYISIGDMADIREDWAGCTWDDIKIERKARYDDREYGPDGNVVALNGWDTKFIELWHSRNRRGLIQDTDASTFDAQQKQSFGS
jgi:hypothetical protein